MLLRKIELWVYPEEANCPFLEGVGMAIAGQPFLSIA